ncbi:MAG: tRNA preQ1(34) S-adenosylmethionine ribosyltransferase-isomerase QueA [candidate division Zixibacteria bacterium]|nr:tRNA preQ1(34) S-adenosylmethionine ribosyltransferase-isomerase QueA [candidate division Zixibacteria bacterium]
MKTIDFDYTLPKELVAQFPSKERDQSRLMILNRVEKKVEHKIFNQIVEYLKPSDGLVINQTKVFPARLRGQKKNSKVKVEVMLLRQSTPDSWEALIRPGRKGKLGEQIVFDNNGLCCEIEEELALGKRLVKFNFEGDFFEILNRLGRIPLPPYIKREPEKEDKDRYQTIYAKDRGAVAAPTAGLHFTSDLLDKIRDMGVKIIPITLHVGLDSFRPIREEDYRQHKLESEYFHLEPSSADNINEIKSKGGRIIAVGTTTTRCLETVSDSSGRVYPQNGWTDKFIYPPYEFKVVDALITNFHLPKSTLLLLVSAFTGREFILQAYDEAIKQKYRFYSYGDAMFIH